MFQVLPVTCETANPAEPEKLERSEDGFAKLLEKEKQKILISPFSLINFQSLVNIPSNFEIKIDNSISKISASTNSNVLSGNKNKGQINVSLKSCNSTDNKTNSANQTESVATTSKADQIRYFNNVINKTFVGELPLNRGFYDALIVSKNRSMSLKAIDVDELALQIQDKIRLIKENGKTELSIELKPEGMGSVLMNISNNKGVLLINIYADQAAKELLEESIKDLERSLKQANLNIGSLTIHNDPKRKNNNRGEHLAGLMYNNS